MLGLKRSEHAVQADREVEKAEGLVAELFGLSPDGAAQALRDEAAATGVSVHATALAVVANWATTAPVLRHRPCPQ
jgi:AmiR/NasT family two-component response regulator